MEFALDAEQRELASTVRTLLDKRSDSAAVRAAADSAAGYDPALWATLAEQIGVAALAVPEEYDGVGASFFETAVVLEELGASVTPSPLLGTTLATSALLAGGTEEARGRLLPRLAAGEIGTLVRDGRPALDADRAAIVLAIVGDDLVEVTGAEVTWAESMDQTIRLGLVDLAGATSAVIGDGVSAAARADLVAAAGVAALAVGVAQRALDETVAYLRTREQFGRPIGSFQALKHRAADLLVRTEIARSASWAASYALGDPAADGEEVASLVHTAASYAVEAAQLVTGEAIQLHGGIAITWEHDAHLWFKRAHALSQLAGAPHQHRAAVTL
ncbi:acyl-CoA dehydrogenase [Nocardioides sp. GY 10113]|uniref:acyl-CoA dehydrogenase family protein n=1 Tax=Nocardioides sp. GY 10113 TaxID=2569761 RepID=UPI0010A9399E|nr:acyl-CoA dehydrogenase family protein [Nocardioides sp. GY 10113]TIC83911.1 acyl-CoA dehydrogenase [Nocardioides sp. GY 10113]